MKQLIALGFFLLLCSSPFTTASAGTTTTTTTVTKVTTTKGGCYTKRHHYKSRHHHWEVGYQYCNHHDCPGDFYTDSYRDYYQGPDPYNCVENESPASCSGLYYPSCRNCGG